MDDDNYAEQIYQLGINAAKNSELGLSFIFVRDAARLGHKNAIKIFDEYKNSNHSLALWQASVLHVSERAV